MYRLVAMTIRCPKCRKKQEEPCPKRCGCGQSLVSLVSLPGRRRIDDSSRIERSETSAQAADNEW